MAMVNGHEILKEDFIQEDNGVYLTKEGLRKYLNKIEKKINSKSKYLKQCEYAISFRYAIDLQIESLKRAIETGDPEEYEPMMIR